MAHDPETVDSLYRKLLSLYPRAFREQMGASMAQTFNDLRNERKRPNADRSFGFVVWMFIETSAGIVKENLSAIKRGETMENVISNNKSAALIGFLLAVPLAALLLTTTYDIGPLSGFYKTLTTEADGHGINTLGRILEIGALLLLPAGLIVSLVPVVRDVRAGKRSTAYRTNLIIAAGLFIFIAALIIIFVIDQYPCWTGVPNCD